VADGFRIGEGFIEVGADADGIARDVDRTVRGLPSRVGGSIGRAGRGIGSAIGAAIAGGIIAPIKAADGAVTKFTGSLLSMGGRFAGPLMAAVPLGIALLPGALRVATAGLAVGGAAIVAAGIAAITAGIAFNGMGGALKALSSGDAEAISEAMARLSPHAQTAAYAIDGVRVASRGLRSIIQERFFAPFAHDIEGLAKDYMPLLEGGLGRVSSALGRGVSGLISWARESATMGQFRTLIDNVGGSMERVNFRGYLNGLLTFVTGGSASLGGLADKVTEWGMTFDRWATRVTTDGSLKRWAADGKAALDQLGNIINSVRGALDAVNTIVQGGNKAAGWLNWLAQGANTSTTDTRGYVQRFIGWFNGSLGPQLKLGIDIAVAWFSSLPGRAGAALSSLGGMITGIALRAWGSFIGATLSGVFRAVGFIRSLPGMAMGALAAFGGMILGVAFRAWSSFAGATMGGVARAVGIARGLPGQAMGAVSSLGGMITGVASRAWSSFVSATQGGASRALGIVRGIPGQVRGALGGLGGLLVGAGSALINGFVSGIRGAIGRVRAAAQSVVAAARAFFPFSPAKEGPFSGRGHTSYSGRALVRDFAGGIRAERGQATAAVRSVLGGARSSIGDGGSGPSAGSTGGAQGQSAGFGGGDVTVHVTQTSGSPAETGRMVALALRTVG